MRKASTFSEAVRAKHSLDERFRVNLWKHLNTIPSGKDTWRERKIFFSNLLEDKDFAIRVANQTFEDGTLELEEVPDERVSDKMAQRAAEIFFDLLSNVSVTKKEYYLKSFCDYRKGMLGKSTVQERSRYKADKFINLMRSFTLDHFNNHVWKYLSKKKLPPMV